MYLLTQLWWCLGLAFLLGAMIGYVIWRSCGRRELQASYERQMRDLEQRFAAIQLERDQFSAAALEAEKECLRLKEVVKGA